MQTFVALLEIVACPIPRAVGFGDELNASAQVLERARRAARVPAVPSVAFRNDGECAIGSPWLLLISLMQRRCRANTDTRLQDPL
jgi:hypothetical protein